MNMDLKVAISSIEWLSLGNYFTLELFILFSIIMIIHVGVYFMASFGNLLNERETTPDWKRDQRREQEEDREREDELKRRLTRQCWLEASKIAYRQRTVYDQTFPDDARLTDELIMQLHTRPRSLLFYELRPDGFDWKLYPLRTNRLGHRNQPVKAIDYMNATGVKWFDNN